MNRSSLPQQALSLVDSLRGTTDAPSDSREASCWTQRDAALALIARSEEFASLAPSASSSSSQSPSPVTNADLEKQLPDGCKGPSAASKDAYVEAALACDSENTTAIALSKQTTWAQRAWASWGDYYDSTLKPLQDLMLKALAVLLAIVLAARLLTPFWRLRWTWEERAPRWLGTRRARSNLLKLASLVALVASGLFVAIPSLWLAWLGVAVIAMVAISYAWSRAMRILIEVHEEGKPEAEAQGLVIALLNELAGGSPSGLETPRASDATVITDAGLATAPANALLKALYAVLQFVLPTAPWRVRIDVGSDDVHSVSITRNGRPWDSAVIDRDVLGMRVGVRDATGSPRYSDADNKTPVLPDLHRMDAAFIVCALREAYGDKDVTGLCGATQWRSLGRHFIATTELDRSPEALTLLADAVNEDPNNRLALVALWRAKFRQSPNKRELELYKEFLDGYVRMRPQVGDEAVGNRALLLRVLASRVAVAVNLAAIEGTFFPGGGEVGDLRNAQEVFAEKKHADVADYAATVETANLLLAASADGVLQGLPREVRSPVEHYRLACLLESTRCSGKPLTDVTGLLKAIQAASGTERQFKDEDEMKAWALGEVVKHLRIADADPRLGGWRSTDPQLAELRKEEAYRNAFGRKSKEASDFLDIEILKPHREALVALGADSPSSLAAYGGGDGVHEIAYLLHVPAARARQLVQVGTLATSVPDNLDRWRVDITGALLSLGKTEINKNGETAALTKHLMAKLEDLREKPKMEDVRAWLEPETEPAPSRLGPLLRRSRSLRRQSR